MKEPEDFESCAERLKALADPDRLRIVTCLFQGEKNVSEIASELGDEVVKVSHHLGILRRAGVVKAVKQGRFVLYRLHPSVSASSDARSKAKRIDFGCCRVDIAE